MTNRVLESYGDAPWLHPDPAGVLLAYAVVFTLWPMQGSFPRARHGRPGGQLRPQR